MTQTVLLCTLVGGLAAVLPAQTQFGAPVPGLDPEIPEVELIATDVPVSQEEKKSEWKSSLNLGGTYATGNTTLRTANLAADASRKAGRQETSVFFSWNYAEQKDNKTLQWGLDERRTRGGTKHKVFLSDAQTTYAFAAVDAENNFNQSIDLRLTATVGLGHPVVNQDDLKWAIELGVGYFLEQSRTTGVKDTDFATGKAGSELDWKINKDWKLLHTLNFFFGLEDADEMYGVSDAKVRASMGEGMFGQLQWILQWDNTPTRRANGTRSDSLDHLFLISIGWAF